MSFDKIFSSGISVFEFCENMAGNSEIKEEYTSSLADLTFNSKPLISVLTILAEENVAQAKEIVEAIENHLSRVRVEVKLPVLYLIDCIIKNVGGPYTALFCQNIVSTFCSVFEQVDERTRAEMFRLRQTWNEVIPAKKLYALDVQIAQLDPAWPVTAPPPNSIHFNPKFLKTTTTTTPGSVTTPVISKPHAAPPLLSSANPSSLDPKTLSMQQKLINKQRELLELQQRKLELELLQTQVKLQEKLQEQLKNQNVTLPSSTCTTTTNSLSNISQNLLLKPEVAKQLAVSSSSNKNTNSLVINAKTKSGTHTVSSTINAKPQNNTGSAVPRIAPVIGSLTNARPIRDPRLLRHQQNSTTSSSSIVVETKSKSGTQVTVESDNKNVVNKTSVRNDRIELRSLNNKGNTESHGKSKTLPHSSPPKHTQKTSNISRKSSKFSRDSSKSTPSCVMPETITDSKSSSSSSLGSPVKNSRSDVSVKNRSPNKSKSKKKSNAVRSENELPSVDKDSSLPVRYDKTTSASCRLDVKDGNIGMSRIDKKSDKQSKIIKSDKDKSRKSDNVSTSFKDLKGSTKNRNYVRRNCNISASPEPPSQDVDLRLGVLPEKQLRIQGDNSTEDKNDDSSNDLSTQAKDVDLRQLPSMIGKKRSSTETRDSPTAKKSRSEMFDVLFGSEDIDLRQLPPVLSSPKAAERPPTPPPPIISSEKNDLNKPDVELKDKKEPEKKEGLSQNSKLQALRAKLANAVNKDKLQEPKRFGETLYDNGKKRKIQEDADARTQPLFTSQMDMSAEKSIIAPSEELSNKGSNMTKAQETALMNKIIAQLETQKLKEAQKDPEGLENISLQPISDDEFEGDFSNSDSDNEIQKKLVCIEDRDSRTKTDGNKDDHVKDDQYKDIRVREDRGSTVPSQINQLDDVYPKFTRHMGHRDPRRGRLWRGRHRSKGWGNLVAGPVLRPGMRPPMRPPAPEPWMRPVNETWRGMAPPQMYSNNFVSEQMMPNISPHLLDQRSQSPIYNLDVPPCTGPPGAIPPLMMLPNLCEAGASNKIDSIATVETSQSEVSLTSSVNVPSISISSQDSGLQQPPPLNINELFQRLVTSGIVTTVASTSTQPEEAPAFVAVAKLKNEKLKPVDFGKPETLKIRRALLIQALYQGMQCSSCGMRFPPEQSMYYSQHLDWHFRQNRRGKKNIRKAASRRWYYSLSDWKNYEELEDLEEREKSYFENQQQSQGEGGNEDADEEIEIPCVPADSNVQNAVCEVCQDRFEQFYNEEKDEWQLRMAIRTDGKTYHPLCYKDYQASLVDVTLDESNKSGLLTESENQSLGIPLLEVSAEEESAKQEKSDNEEDDVMEVIENIDDDETSTSALPDDIKTDDKIEDDEADDDVILNEVIPEKIVLDDDDKDDYVPTDSGLIPGVVVKEEPIDDGFVDVGNGLVKSRTEVVKIKSEPVDNDDPEMELPTADVADTTHIEVVSSIDGNVELEPGVPVVQSANSLSGKIKINITKPLPAIVPKETREIVSEELKSDCIDPSQPLPPGEEPVQLNIKPALKGLELKRQPVVKKGSELTGLCSIM